MVCKSDSASVFVFQVAKLVQLEPKIAQWVEEKYKGRFEERCGRVAQELGRLNDQVVQTTNLISDMSNRTEDALHHRFRPKEDAGKVSKINSLKNHIFRLYKRTMEEEQAKRNLTSLQDFQIVNTRPKEGHVRGPFVDKGDKPFIYSINWEDLRRRIGRAKSERILAQVNRM